MKKILLFSLPLFLITGCAKPAELPPEKGGEEKVADLSGKKILMVVAPVNFRDEEFLRPKEAFESNGAQITVASKGVSEVSGALGARVKVDVDVAEVNVVDYDALVFIGGPGSSVYFDDETVLRLAREAYGQGKVVGAICIASSILANAGILSGKKATAFSSEADNLRTKGAEYTGEAVTIDGKIITASGPQAAVGFGEKIIELLKEQD